MLNMPIPVDIARLTCVCIAEPRPRVVNRETGEVKVDRSGETVYSVSVAVTDETDRQELLKVNVSGEPAVSVGQVVTLVGLVASAWEQERDGRMRWGVAFRAQAVVPASPSASAAA